MSLYYYCSPKILSSTCNIGMRSIFGRLCSTEPLYMLSKQYEKNCRERFNPINIQMLSAGLHRQIFGSNTSCDIDENILNKVIEHLKAHKLWKSETSILPDIELSLPKLEGSNISEHFQNMGEKISGDYKKLLKSLISHDLPPMPSVWKLSSGWTQYDRDGNSHSVAFPENTALVFDVEVCVQEGNYPTLAAAVSENHWYLWCSDRLVRDHFSWSQGISLSDLIPFETAQNQVKPEKHWEPRLLVGHNVSFDRTFIKEQYLLERTKTYFLDTMSLHICVSGLTGMQRAMSIANKKEMAKKDSTEFPDIPVGWSDISSLNNLADVYRLYCDDGVLEKSEREIFVTGSLAEIKERFQELASYCARDVQATYKVLKMITPMFFTRFPHPVTFAGLLEMSTAYLPVNQNWERYLRDSQDTYDDLQKELKLSLVHLANDACSLLHDNVFRNDPWLWDMDWAVQEVKFRKMPPPASSKKKKRKSKTTEETIEEKQNELVLEDAEDSENIIETKRSTSVVEDPTIKHILETAASLRKVRPFLPGYPAWYRELCDKNRHSETIDWEPGPNLISSQMRCVPKLMRLTWDGYPLHYDTKHGWGYLVPDTSKKNMLYDQVFPLEQLFKLCTETEQNSEKAVSNNVDFAWTLVQEPRESKMEEAKLWQSILGEARSGQKRPEIPSDQCSEHYGIGPYNIGIDGCWFFRLPHKDGPHKRVGNPLSKDFLSKVEDGTLKAWEKAQADRALLLSKMLSYWKNAHSRIVSQMVVWLNKEELPNLITQNSNYDETNSYGAILPRLIPAGTVTRRAVEPTWLTASNAYSDRVGSELKSMVQAPPGYHFVGADVDSQELWIAAILGDSQFAKIHGCTAFGWMTLQGKKKYGTDMHSRTASSVGITRDQAKTLNYARIYGAGKPFAQRLLMQFNHRLSPTEAKLKVKKIYSETKGTRRASTTEESANDDDDHLSGIVGFSKKLLWMGGSESHMFNKLEEIAMSSKPQTPVLECRISRALEPRAVDKNFMTSRVNWVVQSSAVDYLHLMLVSMKWLCEEFKINCRLSICIHDEVRYLVKSEDRYRAALALQITNLLTRSFFTFRLGMNDLPQSVAFFSSVDIDSVLRKEVTMDSTTPSNPHGLEKGYGIPPGEALDIFQVIEKSDGGCLNKHEPSNDQNS